MSTVCDLGQSIVLKHRFFRSSNGHIVQCVRLARARDLTSKIKATACRLSKRALATELVMQTSNSLIQPEVTLSTSSNTGGTFEVSARTSNSMISLQYADSPCDSFLASRVITSNSDVCVKMHNTFEGSFELTTSSSSALVRVRLGYKDPVGRRRQCGRHSIKLGM
ncbi:hypothetical protein EDC04DRAFT_2005603 [Pisolithus marmoratus]|nr:hypothetical protein EDC04DRAFT_2005603 [Pisolithus marmoratus]